MRALLNGTPTELPDGCSVADIVALLCPSERGVAVALDRDVVPRSCWAEVTVPDGAHVEVVTAAAGG